MQSDESRDLFQLGFVVRSSFHFGSVSLDELFKIHVSQRIANVVTPGGKIGVIQFFGAQFDGWCVTRDGGGHDDGVGGSVDWDKIV